MICTLRPLTRTGIRTNWPGGEATCGWDFGTAEEYPALLCLPLFPARERSPYLLAISVRFAGRSFPHRPRLCDRQLILLRWHILELSAPHPPPPHLLLFSATMAARSKTRQPRIDPTRFIGTPESSQGTALARFNRDARRVCRMNGKCGPSLRSIANSPDGSIDIIDPSLSLPPCRKFCASSAMEKG